MKMGFLAFAVFALGGIEADAQTRDTNPNGYYLVRDLTPVKSLEQVPGYKSQSYMCGASMHGKTGGHLLFTSQDGKSHMHATVFDSNGNDKYDTADYVSGVSFKEELQEEKKVIFKTWTYRKQTDSTYTCYFEENVFWQGVGFGADPRKNSSTISQKEYADRIKNFSCDPLNNFKAPM